MAICVNSCRNVRRDRRYMDQLMRGPRNTVPPPTPRDYTLREDFKIGKVVLQTIPAMAFDRGCCEWNPGGGYATIYDESADPTGATSPYDILASPPPTSSSATISGDHTAFAGLKAHIYSMDGMDLGEVTIDSATLNGGNTDLFWTPSVPGIPTGGRVVIVCDGDDPQEGGLCFNPRGATRTPYQVYNFTCLPLLVGQRVYMHREFVQGTWIAMPMDPPGRIRVRTLEEISSCRKQQSFTFFSGSTVSSGVVSGDATGLIGKTVLILNSNGDVLGTVTILTAVFAGGNTTLTWEPELDMAPDEGGHVVLPGSTCSGPHEVQLLDYIQDEEFSDSCSLEICEDETMMVYSDLCCTIAANTDLEAIIYSSCDGCLKYYLVDTRPQKIFGINDESIAAFAGGYWKAGMITLYEIDDTGLESPVLDDEMAEIMETVWNGCPFIVEPNSRIQASLKDCKYIIDVVCCPEPVDEMTSTNSATSAPTMTSPTLSEV